MTLFFDPVKQRVQPWVYVFLILLPIIIIIIGFYFSQDTVEDYQIKKEKEAQEQIDIFEVDELPPLPEQTNE